MTQFGTKDIFLNYITFLGYTEEKLKVLSDVFGERSSYTLASFQIFLLESSGILKASLEILSNIN